MKRILKTILISLLALFGMTACSSTTSFTQEDAKEEFNTLWNSVYEAAKNGDRDTFVNNCTSTSSSEYIDQVMNGDFSQDYEETDPIFIGEKDGAYYFCKGQYAVSNAYTSDCSVNYAMVVNCMEKEDGKWKLKVNDEALNDAKAMLFSTNYYGEQAQAAYQAGRNCYYSSSMKAKNTSNFSYPGAFDVTVDGAWQNEDGSVTVCVSLSNGMDQSVYFSDGDVSLEDPQIGEILYGDLNFDINVDAGKTEYEEFTFDANEVEDGTWNLSNMESYMSYNYE